MRGLSAWGRLVVLGVVISVVAACSERDRTMDPEDEGGETPSVDIPGGGSVDLPGLPEGVDVTAEASDPPVLPYGIEAAGPAVRVTASGNLTRPAYFEVPVPPGQNAAELLLVQVEDDGTALVLSTEVVSGALVAGSPGFGTSAISLGRVAGVAQSRSRSRSETASSVVVPATIGENSNPPPEGVPATSPPPVYRIEGPEFLAVGGDAHYNLSTTEFLQLATAEFQVAGVASILETTGPRTIRVQGGEEGRADIYADYTEPSSTTRGFAARAISVQEDAVPEIRMPLVPLGNAAGFRVGDPVGIRAIAPAGVINVRYDFGDGRSQGMFEASVGGVVEYTYTKPGRYNITAEGLTEVGEVRVGADLDIVVEPDELDIVINNVPNLLRVDDEVVNASFSAETRGRDSDLLRFTWDLLPGRQGESHETDASGDNILLSFDQPGTYLLSCEVTERNGPLRSASFTRIVNVLGGQPIRPVLGLPTTEGVTGSPVGVNVSVTGGLLTVNGQKKTYDVTVGWGNGETTTFPLEAFGPQSGANRNLEYTYATPGEYAIQAVITDGVGARGFSPQGSIVTIEEKQSQDTFLADFSLFQESIDCVALSCSPETGGQASILLNYEAETVSVTMNGRGDGTYHDDCTDEGGVEFDLTWGQTYEITGAATFSRSLTEVTFLIESGLIDGTGTCEFSNCMDEDGKDVSCPSASEGPYSFPVRLEGTVDLNTGATSGTIVVIDIGLATTGSWGN